MTNCVNKGGLSVTKHTKIGVFQGNALKKKGGFQGQNGQKFLNISSNLSKFSKNPNFLPKIVTCLTTECKNEGPLCDNDVSGYFGDKEFVKNTGSLGESW